MMEHDIIYYDGSQATGRLVRLALMDDLIKVYDYEENYLSSYYYEELQRDFFCERDDEFRISLSKTSYIITNKDSQILQAISTKAPQIKNTHEINKLIKNKITKISIIAWVVIIGSLTVWPVITPSIAKMIPFKSEDKISAQAINYIVKGRDLPDEDTKNEDKATIFKIFAWTRELGNRAGINDPIDIYFVRGGPINAVTLPANKIVVFCSLARKLTGDELSMVIAHEISHAKNRDPMTSLIQKTGFDALFGGLSTGDTATKITLAQKMMDYGYSRKVESRADREAIELLLSSGYSADGARTSFKKLHKLSNLRDNALDEIVSTHPSYITRTNDALKIIGNRTGLSAITEADMSNLRNACKFNANSED